MKRFLLIAVAISWLVGWAGSTPAWALWDTCGAGRHPWHGAYYHAAWGMPVALVVPPTAEYQTHWGWGVGNTRVTPIRHRFKRKWPGEGSYNRKAFQPTPAWPSDTDQFGTYYIRGPW